MNIQPKSGNLSPQPQTANTQQAQTPPAAPTGTAPAPAPLPAALPPAPQQTPPTLAVPALAIPLMPSPAPAPQPPAGLSARTASGAKPKKPAAPEATVPGQTSSAPAKGKSKTKALRSPRALMSKMLGKKKKAKQQTVSNPTTVSAAIAGQPLVRRSIPGLSSYSSSSTTSFSTLSSSSGPSPQPQGPSPSPSPSPQPFSPSPQPQGYFPSPSPSPQPFSPSPSPSPQPQGYFPSPSPSPQMPNGSSTYSNTDPASPGLTSFNHDIYEDLSGFGIYGDNNPNDIYGTPSINNFDYRAPLASDDAIYGSPFAYHYNQPNSQSIYESIYHDPNHHHISSSMETYDSSIYSAGSTTPPPPKMKILLDKKRGFYIYENNFHHKQLSELFFNFQRGFINKDRIMFSIGTMHSTAFARNTVLPDIQSFIALNSANISRIAPGIDKEILDYLNELANT